MEEIPFNLDSQPKTMDINPSSSVGIGDINFANMEEIKKVIEGIENGSLADKTVTIETSGGNDGVDKVFTITIRNKVQESGEKPVSKKSSFCCKWEKISKNKLKNRLPKSFLSSMGIS